MTTLEAIDLLKTRPPAETTAEELAALRDLVSRLPSLYPLLGGREKVDRFLAAADAAQAEPVAPPPVVVEEPAEAQPIAKIANWVDSLTPRRLVEISLFVVVFAWGIAWLISHLSGSSSSSGDGPKTATASAGEMGPAAAQPAPVEPSPNQLAMAQLPAAHEEFPLEEPDGIWHGWKVVAESGGRAEMKSAWDLSNPTVPRPTRRLFTGGGRVTLTRTWEIPAGAKSLRIECAQSSPGAAGTLELQIDGHPLGKSIVPPAEATWQPQITLGAAAGKSVTATLIYTPGNADEQLEWRQVVASPESMEVMSAGTDPDPTKPALRLWLRADAGVKDAAGRECGTGGAEATVQTWEDQSQRHARLQCDEGNAAQRPTLVLHHPLIGGRAAVAFEGDDFLRAKQSVIYPGAISTTLAVMQIASQTSTLIDTSAPRYCLSIENRPRRRK
ncbi:MAG: hypothetical protein K8T25_02255, partial [Planctomycetia bacterium]|nr:hypothetical protein [Planctomycetia bacterium]